MTTIAVTALRHEGAALLAHVSAWSIDDWNAPSRCVGWRAQDVVCHMAAIYQQLCEPSEVPTDPALGEQSVDLAVDQRRHWFPNEVVDAYRFWSEQALARLERMQDPARGATMTTLGVLGRHPLHLFANAYAFDHHCHIRHDLALDTASGWPDGHDPRDLTKAAIGWMLSAAPQLSDGNLTSVPEPIGLRIDDASYTIRNGASGAAEIVGSGDGGVPGLLPRATIHTSSEAFLMWGTRRASWRDVEVTVDGDESLARQVLEHTRVF